MIIYPAELPVDLTVVGLTIVTALCLYSENSKFILLPEKIDPLTISSSNSY